MMQHRVNLPLMDASAGDLASEIAALKEKIAAQEATTAIAPSVAIPEPAVVAVAPVVATPEPAVVAPPPEAAVSLPDVSLPSVALPDVGLPDVELPAFGLPTELLETVKEYIKEDYIPLVAFSVLFPTALLLMFIFSDLVTNLFTQPKPLQLGSSLPTTLEDGSVMPAEQDTFEDEASMWPTILEIKSVVAAMPAEEQRKLKLETGTNWPPTSTTVKPFDDAREGYTFFQGPSPLTGQQPDMPSFFSGANFQNLQVPNVLKILVPVGGVSFLAVLALLIIG